METRKNEEKQFHDTVRKDSWGQRWSAELEESVREKPLWRNMKYYAIERRSRLAVLDWLKKTCADKRVMDYCCGNGEDALYIAGQGAKEVVGIDISEVSIKNCAERAKKENLANIIFKVMDAEALEFADNSFDVVTEYGALHHLSLDKAYSEISRILKKDGRAICVESLGHNRLIQRYRKVTLDLRTKWEVEHILKRKDIEAARKYFHKIEILGFFHLATIAAVPFRSWRIFHGILRICEFLDMILLRIPLLKWQAWQVVFVLSEPKK